MGNKERRELALAKLREIADAKGWTIVGEYVNSKTKIDMLCENGHGCSSRPADIFSGCGNCMECALNRETGVHRTRSSAAEAKFYETMNDVHQARSVGTYVNSRTPVPSVCRRGHDCAPCPRETNRGYAICEQCRQCGIDEPIAHAENQFRTTMIEVHQAQAITGTYVNAFTRVDVVCRNGHECSPLPNAIAQGHGPCRECAGVCPKAAEVKFRRIMEDDHGMIITGEYAGSTTPVTAVCPEGHACSPQPCNVVNGHGPCPSCSGKSWDAFYVVKSADTVKFGISSGDMRPRLSTHRKDGLTEVVREFTGLPDGVALNVERQVRKTLKDAGESPAYRREYFDITALATIIDVVDGYLATSC